MRKDAWDLPLSEHPEGRDAVRRAYEQGGMSIEEIAKEMGCYVYQAKWVLRSGLEKLAEARFAKENRGA